MAHFPRYLDGTKRFHENDGHLGQIQKGDTVTLAEWDSQPKNSEGSPRGFTGREITFLVGYVDEKTISLLPEIEETPAKKPSRSKT